MRRLISSSIAIYGLVGVPSAAAGAEATSPGFPDGRPPLAQSIPADSRVHAELERNLRAAAAGQSPMATRELACFLYQTRGDDAERIKEAYWHMLSAANCGDLEAILYATAYLRSGVGAKKDDAAANMYLARLMQAIRHRPQDARIFKSGAHAAEEIKRDLCAPVDETSAYRLGMMNFTLLN